jgi:hypothetical protein
MGFVFALREDPIATVNLGFYNDGIFTSDASSLSLALADFYDNEVQGEPFMYARLTAAQLSTGDKYVKPVLATRSVVTTGVANAYAFAVKDSPTSATILAYYNGTDFTAGATPAELSTAEVAPDGAPTGPLAQDEASLYQRRAYLQQRLSDRYLELIRVRIEVALG